MRTFRLSAVLLTVLALGSCQVLEFVFSSVFPSTVALAKAQADLSAQIPANSGGSFNVRILEAGTHEYVVVVGNSSTGNTAYFYDQDLNFKASFSGFVGNSVMVDGAGNIALGSILLDPASLVLTGTGTLGGAVISSSYDCGVDGFVLAGSEIANIGLSGSTLSSGTFGNPWAPGAANTPVTLSTSLSNLQLYAVLDDGNPTGNVILVAGPPGNKSTATCYFITTLKSSFSTGTMPSLDTSPRRDSMETSDFGFSGGSILAYDAGSSSFVRIDPSTGSTQSSMFDGKDQSSMRYAYRISGGSFYGFNTKSRVLMKYAAWW